MPRTTSPDAILLLILLALVIVSVSARFLLFVPRREEPTHQVPVFVAILPDAAGGRDCEPSRAEPNPAPLRPAANLVPSHVAYLHELYPNAARCVEGIRAKVTAGWHVSQVRGPHDGPFAVVYRMDDFDAEAEG